MQHLRTLIVGGGVAGLSTAWQLARRGAEGVMLIERESTFGTHSSGRNAAILRTFTGSGPSTALALETAEFLAAPPPGFAPVPLLEPCGLILVPEPAQRDALGAWRALKPTGSVRDLSSAELLERVPDWRGATAGALLVRDEGRIDTAALLAGLEAGARAAGVELHCGLRVARLALEGGAVRGLFTHSGELITAEKTILAAGGWAGVLGRSAGSRIDLRPMRRHLLVTAADRGIDPDGPVMWSDPDGFYSRPESGGLLLCACDESEVDPNCCESDEQVRVSIAEKSARLLPPLERAGAAHFWSGLRTFAPDREFAIGPDPELPGLSWVAGLGGHGMSTSIALGRLAARGLLDESVQGADGALLEALAPERFAASALAPRR